MLFYVSNVITERSQTNDLVAVYKGVKFSCKFTQKEIEERWHALLLDRHLSKLVDMIMWYCIVITNVKDQVDMCLCVCSGLIYCALDYSIDLL